MDDAKKKVVVLVEDVEAARTALRWALHNILRSGDVLALLHVFPCPRSRNRKRLRQLRLQGYQLALSYRELCSGFTNTSIEIVVTEGDGEGVKIASMVREMGAYALVVGLHDHSFLYRLAMTHDNISATFNCRVHAIRQPSPIPLPLPSSSSSSPVRKKMNVIRATSATPNTTSSSSAPSVDFSQIDLAVLQLPEIRPQKIPYRVCPDPSAIIWRSRKSRRRRRS
ncbi:hypothetical protein MLD38_030095 [Melastoma candidum]|uniref:Uncharacterized protein n=1 Tax=Melastoma candidum TaxID=119954 RepID=A0ACB9MMQ1_9MYRT|nr:hypothetical protein MLD38_030095 [Melastoma candidum]